MNIDINLLKILANRIQHYIKNILVPTLNVKTLQYQIKGLRLSDLFKQKFLYMHIYMQKYLLQETHLKSYMT